MELQLVGAPALADLPRKYVDDLNRRAVELPAGTKLEKTHSVEFYRLIMLSLREMQADGSYPVSVKNRHDAFQEDPAKVTFCSGWNGNFSNFKNRFLDKCKIVDFADMIRGSTGDNVTLYDEARGEFAVPVAIFFEPDKCELVQIDGDYMLPFEFLPATVEANREFIAPGGQVVTFLAAKSYMEQFFRFNHLNLKPLFAPTARPGSLTAGEQQAQRQNSCQPAPRGLPPRTPGNPFRRGAAAVTPAQSISSVPSNDSEDSSNFLKTPPGASADEKAEHFKKGLMKSQKKLRREQQAAKQLSEAHGKLTDAVLIQTEAHGKLTDAVLIQTKDQGKLADAMLIQTQNQANLSKANLMQQDCIGKQQEHIAKQADKLDDEKDKRHAAEIQKIKLERENLELQAKLIKKAEKLSKLESEAYHTLDKFFRSIEILDIDQLTRLIAFPDAMPSIKDEAKNEGGMLPKFAACELRLIGPQNVPKFIAFLNETVCLFCPSTHTLVMLQDSDDRDEVVDEDIALFSQRVPEIGFQSSHSLIFVTGGEKEEDKKDYTLDVASYTDQAAAGVLGTLTKAIALAEDTRSISLEGSETEGKPELPLDPLVISPIFKDGATAKLRGVTWSKSTLTCAQQRVHQTDKGKVALLVTFDRVDFHKERGLYPLLEVDIKKKEPLALGFLNEINIPFPVLTKAIREQCVGKIHFIGVKLEQGQENELKELLLAARSRDCPVVLERMEHVSEHEAAMMDFFEGCDISSNAFSEKAPESEAPTSAVDDSKILRPQFNVFADLPPDLWRCSGKHGCCVLNKNTDDKCVSCTRPRHANDSSAEASIAKFRGVETSSSETKVHGSASAPAATATATATDSFIGATGFMFLPPGASASVTSEPSTGATGFALAASPGKTNATSEAGAITAGFAFNPVDKGSGAGFSVGTTTSSSETKVHGSASASAATDSSVGAMGFIFRPPALVDESKALGGASASGTSEPSTGATGFALATSPGKTNATSEAGAITAGFAFNPVDKGSGSGFSVGTTTSSSETKAHGSASASAATGSSVGAMGSIFRPPASVDESKALGGASASGTSEPPTGATGLTPGTSPGKTKATSEAGATTAGSVSNPVAMGGGAGFSVGTTTMDARVEEDALTAPKTNSTVAAKPQDPKLGSFFLAAGGDNAPAELVAKSAMKKSAASDYPATDGDKKTTGFISGGDTETNNAPSDTRGTVGDQYGGVESKKVHFCDEDDTGTKGVARVSTTTTDDASHSTAGSLATVTASKKEKVPGRSKSKKAKKLSAPAADDAPARNTRSRKQAHTRR